MTAHDPFTQRLDGETVIEMGEEERRLARITIEARNAQIRGELAALDVRCARALRDIALGNVSAGGDGLTPTQRLAGIESEAETLRAQILVEES